MDAAAASSSIFPWDRLPLNIQEAIIFLLPISTLIRCTAVSRSLRSLIRSQSFLQNYQNNPQPLFLISDSRSAIADAYDPLLDHWTTLRIRFASPAGAYISHSAGPLLLASGSVSFTVSNPFLKTLAVLPRPPAYSLIAFISGPTTLPHHFKIVAVRKRSDPAASIVYDSMTREWEMKGVPKIERPSFLVSNGAVAAGDGLLYCLGYCPDCLLKFDLVGGGGWEVLDVDFPVDRCPHLLFFRGKLLLVGGVTTELRREIVGIGIWEMDWTRMEWRVYCFMPEDVFIKFSEGWLGYFRTVERKGMIFFLSSKRFASASTLMCDLSVRRWWHPRACERRNFPAYSWPVHVVEPYIDLVNGSG